jgi:amidase
MTTVADGSDIGGSIRIPAACCGVYGYKPPYGRNPNSLAGSFDPYLHYGPLTRTVADMVLMQNTISGVSVEDIGTLREKLVLPDEYESVRGWKIAYSVDLGYFDVDPDVRANLLATVSRLREQGAVVEEVSPNWTTQTYHAWVDINASRGSAARMVPDFARWREKLSDYVVDMLERASRVTSDRLVRALQVHVDCYRSLAPILDSHRVFLCPTNAVPSVPAERSPLDLDWTIDSKTPSPEVAEAWFMTYPFNMLSQLPVMSVPAGLSSIGVPTGVQIVGPTYADATVFTVAHALESTQPLAGKRPPLAYL